MSCFSGILGGGFEPVHISSFFAEVDIVCVVADRNRVYRQTASSYNTAIQIHLSVFNTEHFLAIWVFYKDIAVVNRKSFIIYSYAVVSVFFRSASYNEVITGYNLTYNDISGYTVLINIIAAVIFAEIQLANSRFSCFPPVVSKDYAVIDDAELFAVVYRITLRIRKKDRAAVSVEGVHTLSVFLCLTQTTEIAAVIYDYFLIFSRESFVFCKNKSLVNPLGSVADLLRHIFNNACDIL